MKKLRSILFLLIIALPAYAQDSLVMPEKFTINGYVKNLQSLLFDKGFKTLTTGNLIHNRINIKWKPSTKITAAVQLRNRLYWGEQVKNTPGFSNLLRNENEAVDMSVTWIDHESMVLHTNIDRLWMEYRTNRWNIRAGRQRINWGMALTWNPNDIFNTYNFLDFDYEERPGSDAVKVQHFLNDVSFVEYAVSPSEKIGNSIIAVRHFFNEWGYDFQYILGWYRNRFTVGTGWAGSIGNVGYKGEAQFYLNKASEDSLTTLNADVEFDYAFKKGWYVNAGVLLNSDGLNKPVDDWKNVNLKFSPQNLMPTKWNFIITSSKEFTPLLTGSMSVVYAPGTNLFILFPTLQYNLATNLDASLVWQSFFTELNNKFQAVNHQCFLRVKWSF